MWLRAIKNIVKDLRKPSNFNHDWYGWATNQFGHFVIGLMLAALFTVIGYWLFGEIPIKFYLWLTIAICYAIWEYLQGWQGWDTIEDWLFVALYGAGGAVFVFSETTIGLSQVSADLFRILVPLSVVIGHILVGSLYRIIKKG